jgi:hypothetical protein
MITMNHRWVKVMMVRTTDATFHEKPARSFD